MKNEQNEKQWEKPEIYVISTSEIKENVLTVNSGTRGGSGFPGEPEP